MDFAKNKLIIISVLITLIIAALGVWIVGDKSGFHIFGDGSAQSSSSSGAATPVVKKDIDTEITEIDKAVSDVNPDDLNQDSISDSSVGI